jgi:tripartite-type tricarboxylate transporter receptor subunit TctC
MRKLTAALLLSVPLLCQAQGFPAKPVKVVVAAAAGGGIDLVIRTMSPVLSEKLGQPIVVENRGGANGAIGAEFVAKSAPDGYTLVFMSPGALVNVLAKPPYDPIKDFTPITIAVSPASPILIGPHVPASNLAELLDYARKNPGKLTFGSTGVGSVPHLTIEALKRSAKLDILHVPYKGVAQALTDMVGGTLDMAIAPLANARPLIDAGKLKAVAVSNLERCPCLPGVPSVFELLPRVDIPDAWFGILGPASIPVPVQQRLHADITATLKAPEIRSKLEGGGLLIIANTPDQFGAQLRKEIDIFGKAAKEYGLKAE